MLPFPASWEVCSKSMVYGYGSNYQWAPSSTFWRMPMPSPA